MVLAAFASLAARLARPGVVTDDPVFRLHYKITSVLLVAFSILVSTKQFFGDPISCIPAARTETPLALLDNYCWSRSTFTLPKAYDGDDAYAYAGVDTQLPGDDVVYHAYYQWVCFFLFLQALLFYLARFLWNNACGGTLEKLFAKRDVPGLAAYLDATLGRHGLEPSAYVLCLLLNAANAVAQMYFTDAFLRGEFLAYGSEALRLPSEQTRVFPLVAKCNFPRYGVGGSVELRDTLCVLPVNVINGKIFLFLWFWYAALACVSLAWIVCLLPLLLVPRCRLLAIGCCKTQEVKTLLRNVVPLCRPGDCFLLHFADSNYVAADFKALLAEMDRRLRETTAPPPGGSDPSRPLLSKLP